MTFIGRFVRGNKLLFEATMFAGYNGVMTGMRPNGFSISINSRYYSYATDFSKLIGNIAHIFMGYHQNTKLIRDALTDCADFDCAYNKLTSINVIAASYFTMAGTKDN